MQAVRVTLFPTGSFDGPFDQRRYFRSGNLRSDSFQISQTVSKINILLLHYFEGLFQTAREGRQGTL